VACERFLTNNRPS